MESLLIEETVFEHFNIHKYKQQAFSMFVGEIQVVELIVDNGLIDIIIDKFGENVQLYKYDCCNFQVFVNVK